MIEGRRLLPYYREALSRDRHANAAYVDCDKCMKNTSREQRRRQGCGFEPRLPKPDAVYVHPGYPVHAFGKPTTCIGYTGKLPIVRLADDLGLDWERGTLQVALGEPPPEILLDTLRDLEWSARAAESWSIAERARAAKAKRAAQEARR